MDRINKVQTEQAHLIKRMNRLLETQIKKASPDLNEHETRWFEELKRMKAQVLGVGRYDSDSMKMRTRKASCCLLDCETCQLMSYAVAIRL